MEIQLIRVSPDSSGSYVAGAKGSALVNGVPTDVHIQGVVLLDDAGNPVPFRDIKQTLDDLVAEARLHTEILLRVLRSIGHEDLAREELIEQMGAEFPPPQENI